MPKNSEHNKIITRAFVIHSKRSCIRNLSRDVSSWNWWKSRIAVAKFLELVTVLKAYPVAMEPIISGCGDGGCR